MECHQCSGGFYRLGDPIPIASETSAAARSHVDGFDSGSPFTSELRSLTVRIPLPSTPEGTCCVRPCLRPQGQMSRVPDLRPSWFPGFARDKLLCPHSWLEEYCDIPYFDTSLAMVSQYYYLWSGASRF